MELLKTFSHHANWILEHIAFQTLMQLVIFAALIFAILITPNVEASARNETQKAYVTGELVCIILFTLEGALFILAHGVGGYFRRDLLGALVVFTSWIEIMLPSLVIGLVGFRALRLLRPLMVLQFFTGLRAVLEGLWENSDSIMQCFKVLLFFIFIMAVMGVQLFSGVLDARCVVSTGTSATHIVYTGNMTLVTPETFCSDHRNCGQGHQCAAGYGTLEGGQAGFDNFAQSALAVFQISTFDFATYLYALNEADNSQSGTVFCGIIIVIIALSISNLFVGIICFGFDKAKEAVEREDAALDDEYEQEILLKASKLDAVSVGGFGTVSPRDAAQECIITESGSGRGAGGGGNQNGASESPPRSPRRKKRESRSPQSESRESKAKELHVDDVPSDAQGTSEVAEEEENMGEALIAHLQQLHEEEERLRVREQEKLKTLKASLYDSEIAVQVNVDGHQIDTLTAQEVEDEKRHPVVKFCKYVITHRRFEPVILGAILLNALCLMLPYHGMNTEYAEALDTTEIVFNIIFVIEFFLKFFGLGPDGYFGEPGNVFDFTIVLLSLLGGLLNFGNDSSLNASALRVLRVLRIARTFYGLKQIKSVQQVLSASVESGRAFTNNLTFLVIVIIMYALCGMNMFGNLLSADVRPNFDNFGNALLVLFAVVTGDGFTSIMFSCMKLSDTSVLIAPIFFISYFALVHSIVLNLLIAAVLSAFADEKERQEKIAQDMILAEKARELERLRYERENSEEVEVQHLFKLFELSCSIFPYSMIPNLVPVL